MPADWATSKPGAKVDYSLLFSESWRVTWRHKHLWVLGLFAFGNGIANGPSYRFGNAGFEQPSSAADPGGALSFLGSHLTIVLALVALAAVVGLALLVVSLISGAGLIYGVDRAYSGSPSGLHPAWSIGVRSFWRLLGLLVLVAVAAVVVVGALAAAFIVPLALAFYRGEGFSPLTAGLIAGGLLVVLLLIPVGAVTSVCLNWAYRSLVLEGTGVGASLAAGWRLFRQRPGTGLILWVLELGLTWVIGLALLGPLLALAFPSALAADLLDGGGPALMLLGLLAGLLVLAAMTILKAVSSTFFATYWTIAYRRLTSPQASPQAVESAPRAGGPITVAPGGYRNPEQASSRQGSLADGPPPPPTASG